MKWVLIVAVGVFVLLLWRLAFGSAARAPKVGEEAPGFLLPDHEGKNRALNSFLGRYLVLYFFPRADTPG